MIHNSILSGKPYHCRHLRLSDARSIASNEKKIWKDLRCCVCIEISYLVFKRKESLFGSNVHCLNQATTISEIYFHWQLISIRNSLHYTINIVGEGDATTTSNLWNVVFAMILYSHDYGWDSGGRTALLMVSLLVFYHDLSWSHQIWNINHNIPTSISWNNEVNLNLFDQYISSRNSYQ